MKIKAIAQNVVAWVNRRPEFVHPYLIHQRVCLLSFHAWVSYKHTISLYDK
jgi:hypothetical protein